MKLREVFEERLMGTFKSRRSSGELFDVYQNPSRSEVAELAREDNIARFIATGGDFHLFSGSLPHHHAIEYIGLNLPSNPTPEQAFMGIVKLDRNGRINYYDSNQVETEEDLKIALQNHSYIERFFR